MPLYERWERQDSNAPSARVLERAISIAERYAAVRGFRAARAARVARGAAEEAAAALRAAHAMASNAVASDAVIAIAASYAVARAVCTPARISATKDAAYAITAARTFQATRSDINRLLSLTDRWGWTDSTPVPPGILGPIWPDGAPEGWHEIESERRLLISIQVGQFAPVEAAAKEIAELIMALNAYHIALGGHGLAVDEWEFLVRETPAPEAR